MSRPTGPVGALDLQVRMARNLGANTLYRTYTSEVFSISPRGPLHPDPTVSPDEAVDREATNLMTAPTYWLEKNMQKVIRLGTTSLPPDVHLTPQDTMSPSGFVVFEDLEPVMDKHDKTLAILAVSWSPAELWFPLPAVNVMSLGYDPNKDQVLSNLRLGFEKGLGEPGMEGLSLPSTLQWDATQQAVAIPGIELVIYTWPWDPMDYNYQEFMDNRSVFVGEPLVVHSNFWPFGYVVPGTSSDSKDPLNAIHAQTHMYRFLYAFWQIARSRIAGQGRLNRSESRRLARSHPDRDLRIVVLRRRDSGGSTQTDPADDGYKIDYRYMVAPHWQRYHTKQGTIWRVRDWYTAGPAQAPLMERDTIYSVQQ